MIKLVIFFILNLLLFKFAAGIHLKTETSQFLTQKLSTHSVQIIPLITKSIDALGQAIVNVINAGQEAGDAATTRYTVTDRIAKKTSNVPQNQSINTTKTLTPQQEQGDRLLAQVGLINLAGSQLREIVKVAFRNSNITMDDCLQVQIKCLNDIDSKRQAKMLSKCNEIGNFCIKKVNSQK